MKIVSNMTEMLAVFRESAMLSLGEQEHVSRCWRMAREAAISCVRRVPHHLGEFDSKVLDKVLGTTTK